MMYCRMNRVECRYADMNGYCDSTACHNMNVVGNIIPNERPENIRNSSIWVKPQSNWHKGTPTDEGFWLVKYKCVVEGKYNGRLTYRAVKIEKDKIDGFAYESGGIGAEEYWKPIEYQKIDDLWRREE